jgi:hypothetical protein
MAEPEPPMATPTAPTNPHLPIRQDWLDRWHEEILEPELPIVDPHHDLWDRLGWRYLLDELLADLTSGHNIPRPSSSNAARCTAPTEPRRCGRSARPSSSTASRR